MVSALWISSALEVRAGGAVVDRVVKDSCPGGRPAKPSADRRHHTRLSLEKGLAARRRNSVQGPEMLGFLNHCCKR